MMRATKQPTIAPRQAVLGLRCGFALVAWCQVGGHLHLGMARSGLDALLIASFYIAATGLLFTWGRGWSVATGLCLALVFQVLGASVGALQRHQVWLLASSLLWLGVSPVSGWRSTAPAPWPAIRVRDPGLQLVRLQLSVVYFFGALHKLTRAFLSGERLEAIAVEHWFGSDLPGMHEGFIAAAWLTVAVELALALGLWNRRLRTGLVPMGLALHVCFAVLLPVQTFSVLAMLHYVAWTSGDLGAAHAPRSTLALV